MSRSRPWRSRAKYGNSKQGGPASAPCYSKLSAQNTCGSGSTAICATGPQLAATPGVSQWPHQAHLPRAQSASAGQCQAFMRPNTAQFSLLWELLTIGATQEIPIESLCWPHYWMTSDARGWLVSPDVTLMVLDATNDSPRRL